MKLKYIFLAFVSIIALSSCSDTDTTVAETVPTYDMSGFAKGADVSWVTEMEAAGTKFYDANGRETECLKLLKSMGVNSIRLRVWVDPTDGWNGKQDVLAKALRAKALGLRVMIDFHYSDSWADPAHQTKPTAWTNHNLDQLKVDVAKHTIDVLQTLKDKGVDVEWVQVGNETPTGMLWKEGAYSDTDQSSFAQLINAGYDAVKSVYPKAQVIIHVDKGNMLGRFTWLFDGLKANGAKWDVIGMSLYPDDSDWETETNDCLSNIKTLEDKYGCKVVLSEIGMPWDSQNAEAFMTKIVTGCKAIDGCLGVFYWEPECYNSWKGYSTGVFDNSGKATSTLNIFKK